MATSYNPLLPLPVANVIWRANDPRKGKTPVHFGPLLSCKMLALWFQIFSFFFFFNFFSTFIYFGDRERQSMNGGGAEREGDTESETGSRL